MEEGWVSERRRRMLTCHEAADELRCHPETIRRAIRAGHLRATYFGGRYLIDRADLPTVLERPAPPPRRPVIRGRFAAIAQELDAA